MIVSIIFIAILIIGSVGGKKEKYLFKGLIAGFSTYTGFIGLFTIVFNGFAAWVLWIEKIYAIKVAIIGAWMNVAGNLISLLVLPFVQPGYHYQSGFQLILLVFYLKKLYKIKKPWEQTFMIA